MNFLGCTLPWFTDKTEHICRHDTNNISQTIQQNIEKYGKVTNNYLGNSYFKPCKNPCETVKIKSQLKTKLKLDFKATRLSFNVNPTVIMARSIMKTSLFDVINNIGSSMGLWLGISIFALFQSLSEFGFSFLSHQRFPQKIFCLKKILSFCLVTFGFIIFAFSVLVFCLSQFL